MPGWHDATTKLRDSGRLAMAGVVLEQHPERARLFMQWKQMDWPVMWDPFNVMELPVVPLSVLVGPDGQVELIRPKLEKLEEIESEFLTKGSSPTGQIPTRPVVSSPGSRASASDWSAYAVHLATWEHESRLDEAVAAAERATSESEESVSWFRAGVVRRMRYDSKLRRPFDFGAAVEAWTKALELDPNNYIWRRRLQQYGPRLAKPYPFYDWVPRAKTDISSRNEEPVPLGVEPSGAEFARPAVEVSESGDGTEPDPAGRIAVDKDELVGVEAICIPALGRPGDSIRTHIVFDPDPARDAHWNNEAGFSEVWFDPPDGWTISERHHRMEPGVGPVSDETRHIELEVGIPGTSVDGTYEPVSYTHLTLPTIYSV